MKTNSIEVKTFYHIQIEFSDFAEIYSKAKDDILREVDHAFEGCDLSDTTIGNLLKCFKALDTTAFSSDAKNRCNDLRYIVRKLGFDGIQHFGGFYKNSELYTITVYNNGCDL